MIKAHFEQDELSLLLAEPPFVPPPHSLDPPEPEEGQTLGRSGFMAWLLDPQYRTENHADWYRKWNYWMMSQRGGTLSYLVFSGGFSLFVYVLFYVACDIFGWSLGSSGLSASTRSLPTSCTGWSRARSSRLCQRTFPVGT